MATGACNPDPPFRAAAGLLEPGAESAGALGARINWPNLPGKRSYAASQLRLHRGCSSKVVLTESDIAGKPGAWAVRRKVPSGNPVNQRHSFRGVKRKGPWARKD